MKITAIKDGKRVEGEMTDYGWLHYQDEGPLYTSLYVFEDAKPIFTKVTHMASAKSRFAEECAILAEHGYTEIAPVEPQARP